MANGEDEAARAFEDLRTEVSLMRRAIERLAAERAEPSDTPDYAETLGIISRNLSATAQRIDAVVNSPALLLTPQEISRQITEVGTAGRNEDRRAIAAARQVIEEVAAKLGRQLDSHLMADEQRGRVRRIGRLGLVLGMVMWATLAGPIARGLPESWLLPERMAARTLRMPMWEGGQRLMRAASPGAFANIVAGNRLVTATRETREACRRQEGKAKKVALRYCGGEDSGAVGLMRVRCKPPVRFISWCEGATARDFRNGLQPVSQTILIENATAFSIAVPNGKGSLSGRSRICE